MPTGSPWRLNPKGVHLYSTRKITPSPFKVSRYSGKEIAMPEEMKKAWPDHYRYVDEIGPEGVTIRCEKWLVCGETSQCWYVIPEARNYLMTNSFYAEALKNTRKRILKYAGGKKFCYPTREEAFNSYRIRKHWQLKHTEHAFQRAKTALAEINRIATPPAIPHICEGGDYFKQMNWDAC